MRIIKPYKRTIREFTDSINQKGGIGNYIKHKDFADSPEHYIRAFLIIQKDFLNLLDYIEPSDINLITYSFRIHELLLRICIEIEANFVAILLENGYQKKGNLNISDFKLINKSHKLSSYEVKLPIWKGNNNIRKPFENWSGETNPSWWEVYNKTKHNRHLNFEKATFGNLSDAICGLIALLSAQFQDTDFSSIDIMCFESSVLPAIGGYFYVKYPIWEEDEKYDFNWTELEQEQNPIDKFNYNSIKNSNHKVPNKNNHK